jgi:hypothetical protein
MKFVTRCVEGDVTRNRKMVAGRLSKHAALLSALCAVVCVPPASSLPRMRSCGMATDGRASSLRNGEFHEKSAQSKLLRISAATSPLILTHRNTFTATTCDYHDQQTLLRVRGGQNSPDLPAKVAEPLIESHPPAPRPPPPAVVAAPVKWGILSFAVAAFAAILFAWPGEMKIDGVPVSYQFSSP